MPGYLQVNFVSFSFGFIFCSMLNSIFGFRKIKIKKKSKFLQQGQGPIISSHTQPGGVVPQIHPIRNVEPMKNNVRLDPFGTS